MMGHQVRLRENDDLPLWQALAIKKKLPFFLMCACQSRVKLCAVRMRTAILQNDLKDPYNP